MAEISAMPSQQGVPYPRGSSRAAEVALWLPGLLVAAGAIAATAHGLYEVAVAAQVPPAIAWLYPVITDGLALVAYAAAARMRGPARHYSWAVVAIAAGLSGLAQAAYLAGDSTVAAPASLRFGVGAWPAVAAAIVAHLLHLMATAPAQPHVLAANGRKANAPSDLPSSSGRTPDVHPSRTASIVLPETEAERSHASPCRSAIQPSSPVPVRDGPQPVRLRPGVRSAEAPARDRARAAADQHARRHGALPTVSQLQEMAKVSRGTAGDVLKAMREEARASQSGRQDPECTAQAFVRAESRTPAETPNSYDPARPHRANGPADRADVDLTDGPLYGGNAVHRTDTADHPYIQIPRPPR